MYQNVQCISFISVHLPYGIHVHTYNIIVYDSTYADIMYNITNTSIHLFLCMYSCTYCVHYNPPCTRKHSHTYIIHMKRDNAPRFENEIKV